MVHPLKDKTAIAGVGASPQGKFPGCTAISLAVEAFKRALDDSGLKKEQIDGLGDKLEAVFDPVTPEVTIPRFKLRERTQP